MAAYFLFESGEVKEWHELEAILDQIGNLPTAKVWRSREIHRWESSPLNIDGIKRLIV